MQSSTAIAFRALIMLIFLISVPLLAIFGRDLPEVIKGLLDGRISVKVTPEPNAEGQPAAAPTSPPSNPFAESAPYRAAPASQAAPAPVTGATTPAIPAANNTPAPGPVVPAGGFPAVQPPKVAQNGQSDTAPPSGFPAQAPSAMTAAPPAQGTPAPASPDVFSAPQDARPVESPEPARPGDATVAGSGDNKFRHIETRLRDMGATQYRLETWGAQNDRYRFECRMAVGGNIGVTQHFEAVDDDPLAAMESVLRQVEDWQRQSAM